MSRGESEFEGELLSFWNLIRIKPQKWEEKEYGGEGGGFWAVAVFETEVVYYNDIEDGFNISEYETYGQIKEYWGNQDELIWAIKRLYKRVKGNK
ncbi:hypothetical protein FBD94_18110 [Pedobacter hiemivivus]|uniref:Uncharacterized protein n=1 Tax=Pedobacter hiemivivus TaxID=2530454 RepID=A0A4U1G5N2_9SPHI|nr:hypothetical protein FBD94_18110 [Pedobacter hiemivivus]